MLHLYSLSEKGQQFDLAHTFRDGEAMRFGHIEIFAQDPLRSLEFYQHVLGFELVSIQSNQLIWLRKGDLEILLRPGQPPTPTSHYENSALGLVWYTEQLEQVLENLKQRGLEIKGTVDSDKCYTFTDPDGNWFQLVDPDDH
jgi:catechol 2,3-dioxygenase-like lactoylglutathione lyase family enzyme